MSEDLLIKVTDDTFEALVLRSELPIVVDFWAEWCPPCGPIARTLAELAGEMRGEVLFAKINSDENPEATRRYRVMSLPTMLLFRGGEVTRTVVGARPKSHLRGAFTA